MNRIFHQWCQKMAGFSRVGWIALSVFCGGENAYAYTAFANGVANLQTVDVGTVPGGLKFLLQSVVISNPNGAASCCARIFKNNSPVSGYITVGATSAIQIKFDTPIEFNVGDVVQVRNGASAGSLHFTVTGDVQSSP